MDPEEDAPATKNIAEKERNVCETQLIGRVLKTAGLPHGVRIREALAFEATDVTNGRSSLRLPLSQMRDHICNYRSSNLHNRNVRLFQSAILQLKASAYRIHLARLASSLVGVLKRWFW